jgi:hypothetical protein
VKLLAVTAVVVLQYSSQHQKKILLHHKIQEKLLALTAVVVLQYSRQHQKKILLHQVSRLQLRQACVQTVRRQTLMVIVHHHQDQI